MSLIHLLRYISLRHVRLQKVQLVLAVSGICLGVAAMAAIDLVNQSVLQSCEDSINHATGRAVLQITGAESGFPEETLDRIQRLPGVEYAVPVIEATASLATGKERALMILGIDVLQDHHIRDYSITDESAEIPDPLLFLAKKDSILLTRALSAQIGIGIDQDIKIQTVAGLKTFKVRGLLNPEGPARVAGGDIAIMDYYAAQVAFGKQGRLDRIDVSLLPGQDFDTMKARIEKALPAGYDVDTPAGRTRQVEILLSRFRTSLGLVGCMALFVGMYLIYNTVSISVVQRRREIGILRALGAGRGQIAGLFLVETLALSTLASLLGVALGFCFSKISIGVVAQSVTEMYVRSPVHELHFSWQALGQTVVIGILASLAAALRPSLVAAGVAPVLAIRSTPYAAERVISGWRLKIAAPLCLLFALCCLLLFETAASGSPLHNVHLVFSAGLFFLLGLSLVVPLLVQRLAPLAHGVLARCFGAQGQIAVLNLQKNASRNGVAMAAILCGIAFFVSSANTVHSMRGSLYAWFDSIIRADLLVSSGHPLATGGSPTIPMPAEMLHEMEAIPGVKSVEPFRKGRVSFNGRKVMLEIFDVALRMQYCPVMIAAGDREDMAGQLPGRDNVVVNEGLAMKEHLKPGDTILLPTPTGPVRFGVAAVVVSFTSDSGVIWMDVNTYRRHWLDPLVDTYEVLVQPGTSIETVRQAILDRFDKERKLFALPAAEFKVEVRKILDRSFVMTNAVNIITLAVAGFGIVITMLASVLERTREIGILRG
ncbi:MAG: ABC transporter permease, partial [Desulfobulbus sp.]